ncbi:intraflagellar transport protein 172 homolog [Atheta coriaria]|uniref:intraflagellar transport protein 172 homolog n=1 Tax=Dalotia coriaria TaxID=877792 RepID=UPI0031F47240
MQIKFLKNILEAENSEYKIVAVTWSPNNKKLAVATSERQVLIFDDDGEKRDRFSTKPADSEAGKKSYVIKSIAFSPDSSKIAVAQSDSIVYVYKIGEKWGEKKAICNKFPQPCPVTAMIWLLTGPIICGLLDGKVRLLQTKSNKSHTLYGSDSLVVALASNATGSGFVSGHIDCSVIRFYVGEHDDDEPQGRLFTHSVPPYALSWPQGFVFAGGSDKRIVVYNNNGRIAKQFDYTKDQNENEFMVACCSPSGQAVAVGGYDKVRVFAWNPSLSMWEESPPKTIPNMYSVTSLSWKKDGSRIACGTHGGYVCLFESVLKRTIWKDKLEITYVGPSQVLIKNLDNDSAGLILRSDYGKEIEDLKVMGRDNFVVARTHGTLLVADIDKNLMSEVSWNNSGKHEKFYFENPNVCLVFNAGELSLIEYGDNTVLASVRTEFANPHLISVRLNERSQTDNKKLAYLLDLKTICITDLIYNMGISQISHESKIDWLELSETCHKLLFRDIKQRLFLVEVMTGNRLCIFSGVTFVQWVESSDVAIAQSGTTLAIWYNIDLPERPTIMNIKGEVYEVARFNNKTEVFALDGNVNLTFELDEGLVEFGTAIHDSDYGRAVLFLETIGNAPEAEAMWFNLSNIAIKQQNLKLLDRCYAALGNISKVYCIKQIEDELLKDEDNQEVWAQLSILNGDLETAEGIYLEHGNLEATLDMYKKLHKWNEAIETAEKRGYEKLPELKEEYMNLLLKTQQFEKAGQILEAEGKYERALTMYDKSNKLSRITNLLLNHDDLMEDHTLVTNILKKLIKQELFEQAAEIYVKQNKTEQAMECYRKGKIWNKAVDMARVIDPEQVVLLEEEWGDHLVESKQTDAAISHYIEAGSTLKALDASIAARQWKKAIHIINVVDDHDSHHLQKYYSQLGLHLAKQRDYTSAEQMFIKARMYKEAVDMYNEAGQWEKAHIIASRYLDPDDVGDMYLKQAEKLKQDGKYREAEKLYLAVNSPDLAITMYKHAEQYDHMIRLVEQFHPELLSTTHMHLAQQMETQGKHRAAEVHYLATNEWKAAMNMYRTINMWEEAYRVAKQNGGATAANQVAFLWARTLPIDSAIKLLTKFGILESCIDYACETFQYDFAFQLCKNLPSKKIDVHYNYAMALEDDGKFNEAETEFILAGKPKEAVLMYTHANDWQSAIRIAETHEPHSVVDVLKAQALQCFQEKNYTEFESLMLRAQSPEMIIQNYKKAELWSDALRVCKDYTPHLLPSLQTEYNAIKRATGGADMSMEMILSRANELAMSGQHKQSVECLLQVDTSFADEDIVRRALLRAADMINKFLFGNEAEDVIKELAPRLRDLSEHTAAAQLYISADMIKEAIDCFILADDWKNARKVAKELDPSLLGYIESCNKDQLAKDGNIEQLADVDIMGALDLLAEQGQWIRCIEKAKTYGGNVLHKYVAMYASQLLKDGFTMEALQLFLSYTTPVIASNFNIYNRIAFNVIAMPNMSEADSYYQWSQLRQMLLDLVNGLDITPNIDMKIKIHFQTLLLIVHYYAVRCVCRQVQVLKNIGTKISVALLRYTDIIPADKGFYEAGLDLRAEGRNSEAFVFLNHYLDICEAIEDEESQLIDHTDLSQTDFPSNIPIPEQLYLNDDKDEHDRVREWVLAISMDQKVDQELPMDDRMMYESSLESGKNACIVSGYPLRAPLVSFVHSEQAANKDVWTKLNMAAKMYPETNVSDLLSFINQWCGAAAAL